MLFKISFQNLKKNVKDYSIYFITLILGVCIFYIFNAIGEQTVMMKVSDTISDTIATMEKAISAMSVVVSFILGFLIVYASRFFLKRRKREFGIYQLLGMRKSSISKILLAETFFIGICSLVFGLLSGIVLSQFMSLFVASMFKADMKQFLFVVSGKAIKKTILYFCLIYFAVLIMNIFVIGRTRLIDLINNGKKGEKVRWKNPVLCLILFLAGCLILGMVYYNVTLGAENLVRETDVFLQIFLGILGTFLVFWSVSGLAEFLLRKMPGIYYKRLHSFVLNEIKSQMNTAVSAGSIICLLLFSTICFLSGAFSLKGYKEETVAGLAPISASIFTDMRDGRTAVDVLAEKGITAENFTKTVDIFTYQTDTVTEESVLGSYADVLGFGEDYNRLKIDVIRLKDYNAAAEMYGKKQLSLSEQEYAIVSDYENAIGFFNEGLKVNDTIMVKGSVLKAKYRECQNGFLMMQYSPGNMGLIVVPDQISFDPEERVGNYFLIDTKEEITELLEPVRKELFVSTQSEIYDESIGSSGLVIFISLYLGIVFMISGAAILALKEMADAIDSRGKYRILRNLGAGEREISHALFQKMAVFFGFPLILAVIHSVFGIQVVNGMLNIYHSDGMINSLTAAAVMIFVIYGGYFFLSYLFCRRVIK